MKTEVKILTNDDQKTESIKLFCQLRPHLVSEEAVLSQLKRQECNGYFVVGVYENDIMTACTGARLSENLIYGPFIYVDDLVTDQCFRSRGFGALLIDWLFDFGKKRTY